MWNEEVTLWPPDPFVFMSLVFEVLECLLFSYWHKDPLCPFWASLAALSTPCKTTQQQIRLLSTWAAK